MNLVGSVMLNNGNIGCGSYYGLNSDQRRSLSGLYRRDKDQAQWNLIKSVEKLTLIIHTGKWMAKLTRCAARWAGKRKETMKDQTETNLESRI